MRFATSTKTAKTKFCPMINSTCTGDVCMQWEWKEHSAVKLGYCSFNAGTTTIKTPHRITRGEPLNIPEEQ